jgi:hypothetical protein
MEPNANALFILRTFSVCFFSLAVGAANLAALSAFVDPDSSFAHFQISLAK